MGWKDWFTNDKPATTDQTETTEYVPTEEDKKKADELLRQAYFGKNNDYQGGPRR